MDTLKRLTLAALAIGALDLQSAAHAYDISTHAYITYKAYKKSVLNPADPNSVVKTLMFDRLDTGIPFNVNYLDNQATNDDPTLYTREAQEQERAVFRRLIDAGRIPDAANVNALEYRIDGWLMDGAIREDDVDLKVLGIWTNFDDRDPDPWGYLFRSSRHFYDPIYDRPFSYAAPCSDYGCIPSPQWALGTTHPLSPPGDAIDTARRNHFTWEDARNNFWGAITKERYPNGGTSADRYASFIEREQRWATALKSLGHVLHLLEDGAQPQHVRNDPHAPPGANLFAGNAATSGAYEAFTDYRVTGLADTGLTSPLRYMDESLPARNHLPDLNLDGYPIPSFATPAEFFTTRYYDSAVNSRRGMQDFANRNFFTAGTYPGFEQCAVPGPGANPCTTRDASPTYALPENDLTNAVYTQAPSPSTFYLNGYLVKTTLFFRQTVDPVSPGFDAQVLPSQFAGKTPIASRATLYNNPPGVPLGATTEVGYDNFVYDANVLLPRAASYAAGMINYFFRGKLAVTAPPDQIVAVLNQGAQHTMNAQGYPCVGTATNDGCTIFGFQSVRVNVQNTTVQITESGPGGISAVQNMAATAVGSVNDPNFHGPYLVAVARYHRNTCYKPDLSGEPYQIYNYTPPSTGITQPVCSGGQVTRTPYQEISVSASLAATSVQLAATAPAFEAHFDFSADPIPVNATDLFIQVLYRGPMGDSNGQEADAIAIGTLDVREPTFASFWNNTDYFWNNSWLHENSANHNEGVETFWACMGGAPVKKVFEYDGAVGSPAMIDPIVNSGKPGLVRLAAIFPPPNFPTQQKNVRGVPVHYPGDQLIVQESIGTQGVFRQANLETIDTATLNAPYAGCTSGLPAGAQYWCFDPVQQRRGQLFGAPFSPLYIDLSFNTASDVDSVPLPAFSGTVPLAAGTNLFDPAGALPTCTTQPAAPTPFTADYQNYLNYLDTLEEARDLGVSGEASPVLEQETPQH